MTLALARVKTTVVFATEDELSVFIDEADSANIKKPIPYAVERKCCICSKI